MLPRKFFVFLSSLSVSSASFVTKWQCVFILFHCDRCKTESINKLETLKFMTFECNFHIVIHVTGLEIIFYITKKGIATLIFHPLNRRSFYLLLLVSLFGSPYLGDTFIDSTLTSLALFTSALHKLSRLLRLAGAKNRRHIIAICCKCKPGEER